MSSEITSTIRKLLVNRYEKDGTGRNAKWVLVHEAPSQQGFSARYCDLIAMGVWKKTKHHVIGHEIKASRSDWLSELQHPEKSDAFLPYCNSWYIVAPSGIVKLDELRSTWGLMELASNGKSLRIRKQADNAKTTTALPLDVIAVWMRRVAVGANEDQIDARVEKAVEAERRVMEATRREGRWEQQYKELRNLVDDFEQTSGVDIKERWNRGRIGEAVKAITEAERGSLAARLSRMAREVNSITSKLQSAAAAVEEIEGESVCQSESKAKSITN